VPDTRIEEDAAPPLQKPAALLACEAARDAFVPCGGDVTGRWEITGDCDWDRDEDVTCDEALAATSFSGMV